MNRLSTDGTSTSQIDRANHALVVCGIRIQSGIPLPIV